MRSDGTYDFLHITETKDKFNRKVFTPTFVIKSNTKDLMIRGKKFYAIFNPETNMWETDINVAMELIDKQVLTWVSNKVGSQIMEDPDYAPVIKRITDTANGLSKKFRTFCEIDLEDRYEPLNQKVKFSNSDIRREDFISYKLPYPLQAGSTTYFKKLMDKLYLPDEQKKICWMIGAMLAGDQGKIQKFFVFFGEPGSGKSTIIDKVIVDTILGGTKSPYTSKFTAELLVNKDSFGTDFLANDPIFAFDDDADLSRVDSRTTLNLIVSHEKVRVNGKFARVFWTYPKCFLVCGTNDPVQVSPRSGFIRRLIDIRPTGELLTPDEYDECISQLQFERSGIASYCLDMYKKMGKNYYNHYIPEDMLSRVDPFHNFVKDNYPELKNGTTLSNAYSLYKVYCETSNFKSIMANYKFRDTLKLYFDDYGDYTDADGKLVQRWFSGFKEEKIGLKTVEPEEAKSSESTGWLTFDKKDSLFDIEYSSQPAQYAKADGTPRLAWSDVRTTLDDLKTTKLHYVKVPENLIVLDFDIKDESGNKSYEKNLAAANKFPPTYAELSKSGSGIHLHYIWTGGDPDELSRVYGDNIEVKVFKGNAALRRQLTSCNSLPIAELSSGLPKKEAKKMVDWEGYKNEKILRAQIIKAINKEYSNIPSTKSSIDFINQLLDEAYSSGQEYDVRDLQEPVLGFALGSTNKAEYCTNLVSYMHFCSRNLEASESANRMTEEYEKAPIIFFDVESYPEGEDPKKEPALFVVCWKFQGEDRPVTKMINPSPADVEKLFHYRMIGFYNLEYDNHMVYARSMGYTEAELNRLSQRLVSDDKSAKFRDAKNISYTDVYDFAAAGHKQTLKKWEIELGIHHVEMSIPWDQPAPRDRWNDIADYCANDVIATEAVFNHLYSDFVAREILADLSGLTVNDKTNRHTISILTHGIKNPQNQYVYTKLGEMRWPDGSLIFPGYEYNPYGIKHSRYRPGVKIVSGKSIYKGIDPGEGGRKIGYPGMYSWVALLDIQSEHPSSAIKLNIFGDTITERFAAIVKARIAIKHGEYNEAIDLLKVLGKDVSKYFQGTEEEVARNTAGLSDALKTSINSVYGLTSASFDNELRDPRNIDNIVAKYGALFMINLEEEVTSRGYTIVHCSTDSMKVANADQKIVDFMTEYATQYGYTFEFEALYEKMTIVNEAVYIAKYATIDECMKRFNYIPGDNKKAEKKNPNMLWTPTGKQFAVPYVFKTLFSHEPIEFKDMNETFSVQKGAIYLDYSEGLPDVTMYEDPLKKLNSAYAKCNRLAREYSDPVAYAEVELGGKKDARTREEIKVDVDKNQKQIDRLQSRILNLVGFAEGSDINDALAILKQEIDKGHDYRFVGRVGSFVPMLQGSGAAEMVCIKDDKYNPTSPSGSKGFMWQETEVVLATNKQDQIDRGFYRKLVDDAISAISKYGDYDWFVS